MGTTSFKLNNTPVFFIHSLSHAYLFCNPILHNIQGPHPCSTPTPVLSSKK